MTPGWLGDIGLQRRIIIYVAVSLAALFLVFAYVAIDSSNRSSDAILLERERLAGALAENLDTAITASAAVVDFASIAHRNSPDGGTTALQTLLDGLRRELLIINGDGSVAFVALVGSDGALSAFAPVDALAPLPSSALTALGPSTPAVVYITDDDVMIGLASAAGPGERIVALLRPGHGLLGVSSGVGREEAGYRGELVTMDGKVIESSDGLTAASSRHAEILPALTGGPGGRVAEHASDDGNGKSVRHVVAYAPLSSVPLGVLLEQPEDLALKLPNDLRVRIMVIAGGGIAAGLVLAWVTARQVVRPLERLTERARAIADGDLEHPVLPSGQDEIRRLGESFEVMRSRLERSQSELAEWGHTLETRVQERTRELEIRDRERVELLGKVISAQEEERRRVARELHDQVGQSLTALVMQLGSVESSLSREHPEASRNIGSVRETASSTIEEVRRLMSDLRPSILDDMGLASAVSWYVESRLDGVVDSAEIQVGEIPRQLPPNVEISIFRVVQEAVNNIVKHASARKVTVSLRAAEGRLSGKIVDDGKGFMTTAADRGSDGGWAVGLLGMEERISLLGGEFSLDSEPGKGTAITFTVPVDGEVRP